MSSIIRLYVSTNLCMVNKKLLYTLSIMTLTSVFAGVLNFAYHPFVLRFLSIEDFAIFQVLVSIINILGVTVSGLGLYITKITSQQKDNTHHIHNIFVHYMKQWFWIGCLAFLGYILFSPVLESILDTNHFVLLILTGSVLLFSFVGIVLQAFLTGLKHVLILSYNTLITSFLKIVIGSLFFMFGLSLWGAFLGYISFYIIILFFPVLYIVYILKIPQKEFIENKELHTSLKDTNNILQLSFLSIITACLINSDILLAHRLFDASIVWQYAALSVLAKGIVFVASVFETYYYPTIIKKDVWVKKTIQECIWIFVVVLILITICGYIVWPYVLEFIKPWLAVYILPFVGLILYFGIMSLLSLFAKVIVGWHYYRISVILTIVFLGQIFCCFVFTISSIQDFIEVFSLSGIWLSTILGLWLWVSYRLRRRPLHSA